MKNMCGIVGFSGCGDESSLQKMAETLRHRGPDDDGFYFEDGIGLGFRRLSIIDLNTGHQPIFNEDKSIVVIFNGEIYNFEELRRDLSARHNFYTKTDTEVIVHLYEELCEKCFEKFNGMFAIAIWDRRRNKLVLARDRMGKKPLYYFWDGKNFIFASELKAIKAHPLFRAELDLASLNKYLLYEYVPSPHSIFKNTQKVLPGNYLVLQDGRISVEYFWNTAFGGREDAPEKEILGKIDALIDDAVKIRLISDVPLGVFLSGGLDSSAVAYYAQKNSVFKINTFSIGFDDRSFDESGYAKCAADFLGTNHHTDVLTSRQAQELIPKIVDFLDEPMADASVIPTYFLSKFARQKVTVALGGDGGDELFMGYPTYLAHKFCGIYEKLPKFLRKNILELSVARLPVSLNNMSFDFRAKRFVSGLGLRSEYRNQIWLGAFGREERAELFRPEIWSELKNQNEFEDIDREIAPLAAEPTINKIIKLYQKHYLADEVLAKVDRASMASSLEVRAPLLDYRLVDFMNFVSFDKKMKNLKAKYLLKKLMAGKLPDKIINRSKKGFGVPLAKWFKGELRPFILEILSPEKIEKEGLFNWQFVNKLMQEHFDGKKDNKKPIWTLLMFELWLDRWHKA